MLLVAKFKTSFSQIKGDNETKFIVQTSLQSPPINPTNPSTPLCCGSTTSNVNVETDVTGIFERDASGGSFKVCLSCKWNVIVID